MLWYGVSLRLATVTWAHQQTGTAAEIPPSSVLRALWLVTVGITLWALGLFTGRDVQPGAGGGLMTALDLRFSA